MIGSDQPPVSLGPANSSGLLARQRIASLLPGKSAGVADLLKSLNPERVFAYRCPAANKYWRSRSRR